MMIRVQLFGPEAASLGTNHVNVEVPEKCTCQSLLDALQQTHPALSGRLAVNHAFASPEVPICEDDEVALIGLVSGG